MVEDATGIDSPGAQTYLQYVAHPGRETRRRFRQLRDYSSKPVRAAGQDGDAPTMRVIAVVVDAASPPRLTALEESNEDVGKKGKHSACSR